MSIPAKSISNNIKKPIEVINRQRILKLNRNQIEQLGQSVFLRIHRNEATATVSFIRDAMMQQLNRDYRGIDKPTDVLAFAYHEGISDNEPDLNPDFLGDVVISVETAARYAQEQNISCETEINWLVIHGLLHLAGYDHETDNGEMRRLERRLRKVLLSSPSSVV